MNSSINNISKIREFCWVARFNVNFNLFKGGRCACCHEAVLYTSQRVGEIYKK